METINLNKLSKRLVYEVTRHAGGDHSEIVLYKENAKQKDVTAATKYIGGYVKHSEKSSRYSSRRNRTENDADDRSKQYSTVLIKINNEFKYAAEWSSYTDTGGNFELIGKEGNETASRWISGGYYNSGRYGKRNALKAGEISKFIDFNENVEVYLVKRDDNRSAIHKKRVNSREIDRKYTPSFKKKALVKFINKKTDNIVENIHTELTKTITKIQTNVDLMFSKALVGKDTDNEKITDVLNELSAKYGTAESVAYNIRSIIEDGTVFERYSKRKTYTYQRLIELTNSLIESETEKVSVS